MPLTPINLILLSAIIGGIIGYFTNSLALYMLFHPRKKILGIQGIIPKRKDKLSENIANHIHIAFPQAYQKIKSIPIIGEGLDILIKKNVAKSIRETPNEEIEKTVKNVVHKELTFIKILGGLIGILIGIIQGIIYLRS